MLEPLPLQRLFKEEIPQFSFYSGLFKDVAWADSELYHLGPIVTAQQIHPFTCSLGIIG